jgi:sec-independent protein translocase protein TatB
MFGMGFWEIVVVAIVGIVVIGPKELPGMLRKAGQWAGKMRRMALDLRVQSGIDDVLRADGIGEDLAEIRKLARGELDGVHRATRSEPYVAPTAPEPIMSEYRAVDEAHLRIREYPRDGADAYGCMGDAIQSDYALSPSALARDPLYVLGDAGGVLPDPTPAPDTSAEASVATGVSDLPMSSEHVNDHDAAGTEDAPTEHAMASAEKDPGDNAPIADGPTLGEA